MKSPLLWTRFQAVAEPCTGRLVQIYHSNYCFENLRDELSFALGMASALCWIFAEVPQIVTNFRTKSAHGLSLLLLLTWIAGDLFNLSGCLLEPSTLPTQLYTAVLYVMGSSTLVSQCVYYEHFLPWYKQRGMKKRRDGESKDIKDDVSEPLLDSIQVSPRGLDAHSPLDAQNYDTVLDYYCRTPPHKNCIITGSMKILKMATSYGTFVAASASLPHRANAFFFFPLIAKHNRSKDQHIPAYGQLSGWLMASIYISGRLPQIWLNLKKGNAEGLNPLLFSFTLVANIAYIASILVRSTKWEKIKRELPWLLDASMCALLDILILLQYFYYRCSNTTRGSKRRECSSIEAPPQVS